VRFLDVMTIVVLVSLVVLWLVWIRASRLDRLHRKVAAARSVVDAQLSRRATIASELATSGLLDPVSSMVLGESAWQALSAATAATPLELKALLDSAPGAETAASGIAQESAESELTAALTEILSDDQEVQRLKADPVGADLLDRLVAAWYRVQLARRFHNEAVAQALRVRRGRAVRLLRLAGHAPMPGSCELDDAWPITLDGYEGR
jgi:hypothetical protein